MSGSFFLPGLLREIGRSTNPAARKNIKKAANAARKRRTIAHPPKSVRTALGRKGAQAVKGKRSKA